MRTRGCSSAAPASWAASSLVISDRVFGSRRGPVAAILYGLMLLGGIVLVFAYQTPYVGAIVVLMSMAVIGVPGMLSGTASMDFGGKQNVGTAVGIIDGFVYAGTGVMALLYMYILPDDSNPLVAGNPDEWIWWPVSMIPISLLGLLLATRVWNAKPKGQVGRSAAGVPSSNLLGAPARDKEIRSPRSGPRQ